MATKTQKFQKNRKKRKMLKKTKEGIKIIKKMPKKEKRKTLNKIHFINCKKNFLEIKPRKKQNTKQNRLSIITEGGRL